MAKKVPTSIELDDEENRNRSQDFSAALAVGRSSPRDVLRGLVDAFIAYVEANGHVPPWPVEIVPVKKEK